MWIRHLPADYYKQQSDFDNLVFLWKTNNVYVMDNHLAAAWCWMQECNTDTRYNFCTLIGIMILAQIHLLIYIGISRIINICL